MRNCAEDVDNLLTRVEYRCAHKDKKVLLGRSDLSAKMSGGQARKRNVFSLSKTRRNIDPGIKCSKEQKSSKSR